MGSASESDSNFSTGRAYRYEFFHPVARKIFDVEQWAVQRDVDSSTCDPGVIDPNMARPPFPAPKPPPPAPKPTSPTPPRPRPTPPSGSGSGKGKKNSKKRGL